MASVVAAAAAAMFSIIPVTAREVDPAIRIPVSPAHQAHPVGLDYSGGDLRRAVRLTRRAQRLRLGQPWTDDKFVVRRQAIYRPL